MTLTLAWLVSGHSTGGGVASDTAASPGPGEEKPFPKFLPLERKLTYFSYESYPPDVLVSSGYLENLTIEQCAEAEKQIPLTTLANGTLRVVGWSQTVLKPKTGTFLLAGSIPSLKDIRIFLGDQPEKFAEGYRSVIIEAHGTESFHLRTCYPLKHSVYRGHILCSFPRRTNMVEHLAISRLNGESERRCGRCLYSQPTGP